MSVSDLASAIQIQSYKHNGRLHRVWEENFILKSTDTIMIGANDKTQVRESNGHIWRTREPAIFYFHSEYWFNVIGMLRNNGINYYCNISSPFVFEERAVKYIDYDLDVKVYPDMTYRIVDEDEFEIHKKQMRYPRKLEPILYKNVDLLIKWIQQRKGPFAPGFIEGWYERYLSYRPGYSH